MFQGALGERLLPRSSVPGGAAPLSRGLSANVNSEAEARLRRPERKAVATRSTHFLPMSGVFDLRRAEGVPEGAP